MITSPKPKYWSLAISELINSDRVLAQIIQSYSGEGLAPRGDPFGTLTRAIVGQQISTVAATAIWDRMEKSLKVVTPEAVINHEESKLRDFGLTKQKCSYIFGLANSFSSGEINSGLWDESDDEKIVQSLIKFKGIGRWTAEMFLIFYLARPDVLPLSDLGLQKGISNLYGNGKEFSQLNISEISGVWRPWRSVATWYIWRNLDPKPVNY